MASRNPQKVFAIGFHRTATTTFQTALEELGFRVVGMRKKEWNAYVMKDFETIGQTISEYDGFRDMPWPLMYKWLDKNVPNAKFILTYRSPDAWVESCRENYKDRPYDMFSTIYGFESFIGNEEHAREVYLSHIQSVRDYFADRPNQFLEIDLTKDGGWMALCRFLKMPVPDRHFPHANKRPKSNFQKFRARVLRAIAPNRYARLRRDK